MILADLKERIGRLKAETLALYLAVRHPGTPWYAKAFAAAVVAYAFSPIDLIPDFIPVFGYLDDLLLLPVGLWISLRLIPEPVMAECRMLAAERIKVRPPRSMTAAIVIITVWILAAAALLTWGYGVFSWR